MQPLSWPESVGLLIAAARRRMRQAVGREATRHALSSQQFWYLVGIAETEGLAQRELAERLRTDASTASRVVFSLVQRGLVRVGDHPPDRRRSALFLTPRGTTLARRLVPKAQAIRAAMLEGLAEPEREGLRRALRVVIANLDRLLARSARRIAVPAEPRELKLGRTRALLAGLALTALGAVQGCSQGLAKPGAPAAVPVVVARAEQRDVPLAVEAIGSVEAYTTVAVRPQVSGTIAKAHFAEGADVRAGDLLFTIDPRPFEAALAQAESNLARDQAQARNAAAEAARADALYEQGILSKESREAALAGRDALAATVRADGAAVDNARLQLAYCAVRAPVSGRTGRILVQPGNVVQAVSGGPLVVVNRIEPVYVTFSVPEPRLAEVRRAAAGSRLKVLAAARAEDEPSAGELSFLDNEVDRATGTFRLKGTFANHERRLWPGQFVNARLFLGVLRGAVVVSSAAVQTGQQGPYLFVVKPDGTAEVRLIALGPAQGGDVVVAKGLASGETVVTDGQVRLVPGARVDARPALAGGSKRPLDGSHAS